jgi:HK97 family phage major capsid protein
MELSTLSSEQYRKLEVVELMRLLSAKANAQGDSATAEYYQQRWGRSPTASMVTKAFEWERKTRDEWVTKAAVSAGNTTDAAWAGPLAASRLITGFLGLVRQASVLSQMPTAPIPFQVTMPFQVSGSSMKWVGENSPKPATKLGFGNITLSRLKAAGIVVVSRELMTFSAPGSEQALQQILLNELTSFVDSALLGAAAASAANPAGILNGVTVSASIAATISAFFTSRPKAIAPTWIVSPANVGALSALDPTNVPTRFKGYPLVVSPSAGANLILLDPPVLAVADDGLELDVSDQAIVQMDDAPAPASAATIYANLWQDNLAGIRVERYINWKVLAGSVQFTATLT